MAWCFQSSWKQWVDLVHLRVSDHLSFYYLGTAHIFQLQSSLTVAKTCFLGWRASLSVKYGTQLLNEQRIFSVSIFIFSKSIGFGFLCYEQFCRLTGVLSASIWMQSNLHVRPPLVSDHLPKPTANPKHQNVPSQRLAVGISSKRPPPVSDRDHLLGLTVNDFPWLLTSCKRPLDAFSDLNFRCVHYVT